MNKRTRSTSGVPTEADADDGSRYYRPWESEKDPEGRALKTRKRRRRRSLLFALGVAVAIGIIPAAIAAEHGIRVWIGSKYSMSPDLAAWGQPCLLVKDGTEPVYEVIASLPKRRNPEDIPVDPGYSVWGIDMSCARRADGAPSLDVYEVRLSTGANVYVNSYHRFALVWGQPNQTQWFILPDGETPERVTVTYRVSSVRRSATWTDDGEG